MVSLQLLSPALFSGNWGNANAGNVDTTGETNNTGVNNGGGVRL